MTNERDNISAFPGGEGDAIEAAMQPDLDNPDEAMFGGDGEGDQDTFLPPDVPPGYLLPPTGQVFANATWLTASAQVKRLVSEMIEDYDEFSDLRGVAYEVVWRRNGKPMMSDEMPKFAAADITPPRYVWQAYQDGVENFPLFSVDLFWTHFDDLRRGKRPGEREIPEGEQRSAEYVHEKVLQQHIHHALSSLYVDNDIVHRRGPDFSGFAATVKRFGQWNEGVVSLANQLSLWPSRDEG